MGGPAATVQEANANAAWWVGGAMVVVVILFMLMPLITGEDPPAATPNAPFANGGGAGGAGAVDLSSMTPKEAAIRLFNRVMTAAENNNDGEVSMFLPMAIQAYEMLDAPDPVTQYHLSRLKLTGTFNDEALGAAQAGLDLYPDHLLNLYAAGDAALAMGDQALAQQYFGRILEVWDAEMASGNVDYEAHARQMNSIREYAAANVGG